MQQEDLDKIQKISEKDWKPTDTAEVEKFLRTARFPDLCISFWVNKYFNFVFPNGTKVEDGAKHIASYYVPIFPWDPLLYPLDATKHLQSKLKFEMKPSDLLWANYVHLVMGVLVRDPVVRWRPFGEIIVTAIENLVDKQGIKQCDPYELWIEAGIITPELEPTDPTPYGQLTGEIIQ